MTAHPYRRRQSSPATLLTRIRQNQPELEQNQEEQEEMEQEETQDNNGGPNEPTEEEVEAGSEELENWNTQHLTRLGVPDRRFMENRGLSEEDVGLQHYRRSKSARVVNGIHITEDGTPDRRYKENRALTDEDIEILKAELILEKHGIRKEEISPTAILARHASSDAITQPRMEAVRKESGTRQKAVVGRGGSQQQQKATGTGGRRR